MARYFFAALASSVFILSRSAVAQAPGYETPEVYPTPSTSGLGGWQDALSLAQSFVDELTLDEKFLIVIGTGGPCVGNIAPIPRLNFTGLCLMDGPLGLKQGTYSSAFPAGLTAAASWDRSLIRQRGVDLGAEFKAKGAHILLGPVAGPLGRSNLGGRNWEGFAADPYLTGVAMAETISGIQSSGVQACAKHFLLNEQETQRNPSYPNGTMQFADNPEATIKAVSSNADDRTIHELYLWPFADAVKAGVATAMCGYNRVNGTYSCENSKVLNGLLKEELGFQGYVMSDWGAQHSTMPSIAAGEDMEMPGDRPGTLFTNVWNGTIQEFYANGTLTTARLDDMVLRILTPYFYLGQHENFPAVDPSAAILNTYSSSLYHFDFNLTSAINRDVRGCHASHIRKLGAEASVLLKNVNGALPLKAPKTIGIFGNAAADITNGMYSFQIEDIGALPVGGGSGTARFSYMVSPLEAIKARAAKDRALVQYITNNTIAASSISTIYPIPEVCIVFLKTYVVEGSDRSGYYSDAHGDSVVTTVASKCNNTIVITHSGGANIFPWADNENVTAIIAAHFPGEEIGNSIVDVLYGDVSPSGRLPYTIAYNASDYNAPIANFSGTNDTNAWQSNFTEGLMLDYRHFDNANITPRYEFGFGLSYTTFSVSDLSVRALESTISATPAAMSGLTPPGGNPDLYAELVEVSVIIINNGLVEGKATPQLYLSPPQSGVPSGTPPQALRGFEKINLTPNESSTVTFKLTRRDVSYWDVVTQQWLIPKGEFGVKVGFSSRDQPLQSSITLVA